ncbi:polyadenylate-binding protein-interacting protein 1-like [Artemia franciscana]|uniref:MIF4G domain-containing protein n=1 Tax=Artemia franciscana TaxID=6661 RepID=A0AA88I4F0_ARTSF|nr:hypothetical protein QYM36_002962 [Artemia franciscana]
MDNTIGRGRGRGKRPEQQLYQPLRRPKTSTERDNDSTSSNKLHEQFDSSSQMIDQCLADRASNLNLNTLPGISNVFPSVESRAPFVPSVSAATTVTSILNAAPVATSSLNASAAPFVPQFYRRRSSSELSDRSSSRDGITTPGLDLFSSEDDYHPLVQYLTEVLSRVTLFPGKFESHSTKLISAFKKLVIPDVEVLGAIVETIYYQSVIEPNFCYNGARLCAVLCNKLDVKFGKDTFRTLFLQRLQVDHKRRYDFLQEDPKQFRGYALFICEVYVNLEVSAGNVTQRLLFLNPVLYDVLSMLINSDSENIRCVCKCLKLAGSALEDDEKWSGNPSASHMASIEQSLKQIALKSTATKDVMLMILNVLELKASDWGRSKVSPEAQPDLLKGTPAPFETTYYHDGAPLHYGQGSANFYGNEFYETEYPFEDENCVFSSEDEFEDGMDPEIQQAFEEFMNGT